MGQWACAAGACGGLHFPHGILNATRGGGIFLFVSTISCFSVKLFFSSPTSCGGTRANPTLTTATRLSALDTQTDRPTGATAPPHNPCPPAFQGQRLKLHWLAEPPCLISAGWNAGEAPPPPSHPDPPPTQPDKCCHWPPCWKDQMKKKKEKKRGGGGAGHRLKLDSCDVTPPPPFLIYFFYRSQ